MEQTSAAGRKIGRLELIRTGHHRKGSEHRHTGNHGANQSWRPVSNTFADFLSSEPADDPLFEHGSRLYVVESGATEHSERLMSLLIVTAALFASLSVGIEKLDLALG